MEAVCSVDGLLTRVIWSLSFNEATKLGGSLAGRAARLPVLPEDLIFLCGYRRTVPQLRASGPFFIKAKSLKVWLRQILRALPAVVLHYSNNLQPVSSLVKREVIPLLTFALRVLCIGSAFVCGRAAGPRGQLSVFPVRVQAIELCSHLHIVNFIFSSTILLLTLCSAPGLCLACAGEFTWSSWTWKRLKISAGLRICKILDGLDGILFLQGKLCVLLSSSYRRNRTCLSNQGQRRE